MRSILDMISCRNAPVAPGADPEGFRLVDLEPGDCRFPTSETHQGVRFCAMPVDNIAGSYCCFHRGYLAGQRDEDEREAA